MVMDKIILLSCEGKFSAWETEFCALQNKITALQNLICRAVIAVWAHQRAFRMGAAPKLLT
jgi:hypothetical protein